MGPPDGNVFRPLACHTESGFVRQHVTKAFDIDNPAAVARTNTSRDSLVTQPKLRDRRAQP